MKANFQFFFLKKVRPSFVEILYHFVKGHLFCLGIQLFASCFSEAQFIKGRITSDMQTDILPLNVGIINFMTAFTFHK